MEIEYISKHGTPNALKAWSFESALEALTFFNLLKKTLKKFTYRKPADSTRFYLKKQGDTARKTVHSGPSFRLYRSGNRILLCWYALEQDRSKWITLWKSFPDIFEALDDEYKKVLAFHMDIFS